MPALQTFASCEDMIDVLAGCSGTHGEGVQEERIREAGLNPTDPHLKKVLELTRQYMGFPAS